MIGRADTDAFLASQPVGIIWGVGQAARDRLAREGIRTIADIRAATARRSPRPTAPTATASGASPTARTTAASRPVHAVKSVSNETTFFEDTSDAELLDGHLWRLSEKVSARLKAKDIAGRVVTAETQARRPPPADPPRLPARAHAARRAIHAAAAPLLSRSLPEGPFRLIGIGLSDLVPGAQADLSADLLEPDAKRRRAAEAATDSIRARFGDTAIVKGRALR